MKKIILFGITILSVAIIFSCSKDDSPNEESNTDSITDNNDTDGNTTVADLPNTYIVIKYDVSIAADTLWMVSKTKLPDPIFYRYQVNFGTKAQLEQSPDEVGQNSTIGFVMSYIEKPVNSAAYNYTSKRWLTDNSTVNFYLSFGINTGYVIENKNYLTPDTGLLDVLITGNNFKTEFNSIEISDEADSTNKIMLSGLFDFDL